MACTKHGYTNNTFCPACDLETIERNRPTKPPSHEEVRQVIAWHVALQEGQVDETRADALKCALEECDEMLESLLADNVRLSGEVDRLNQDIDDTMLERDQLRARIGELETAAQGYVDTANDLAAIGDFVLHKLDRATVGEYASEVLTAITEKDERIAALEKDAAEALGVLRWAIRYMEISSDIRQTEAVIAKLDAALNPQLQNYGK
jgi:hypothetical protein